MDFFDRFTIPPHDDPMLYASIVAIGLVSIAIVLGVTYFKKNGVIFGVSG